MKIKQNGPRAKNWERHLLLQNFLLLLCTFLAVWALLSVLVSVFNVDPVTIPDGKKVLKALVHAVALKFPAPIEELLNGSAILEILGTIGLLTVAGPLLAITEQRVLGERIGALVKWAYPWFFTYYFSSFIVTILLGIYAAAKDNNKTAIALTFVTVLIGTGFILWVCHIFLIPGKRRERLALTYYANRLLSCSENHAQEDVKAHLLQCRQLMLKLAGALARREAEGRELWAENIRELWICCAWQCQKAQKCLGVAHPQEKLTNYCCQLAKEFWTRLSQQAGMSLSHLELLPALLFSYAPSRKPDQEEIKIDCQVEDYLAAGLLFTEAFQQAGENQDWQTPYQILCDLYCGKDEWTDRGRTAFKKLSWGLAWMAVLHSAYETKADFRFLRELYYRGSLERMSFEEEQKIRNFLKLFRRFYWQKTRFQDGVNVANAGPVDYTTRILDFLQVYLDDPQKILGIDPEDDFAVIQEVLLKEDM